MSTSLAIQTPEIHLLAEWKQALDLDVQSGEISTASRDTYSNGMHKFYTGLLHQGLSRFHLMQSRRGKLLSWNKV
jgi:hypothetical protein